MLRCLLRSRHTWLRPSALRVQATHLEQHRLPRNLVHANQRYLHQPNGLPQEAGAALGIDRDRFWNADGKPTVELYDHYLGIDIKPRPHRASSWVHDLDTAACLEPLPQDLRADPLACFQQRDLDLDLAGHCMQAFVVSQHNQASAVDARERIVERRLAVVSCYG